MLNFFLETFLKWKKKKLKTKIFLEFFILLFFEIFLFHNFVLYIQFYKIVIYFEFQVSFECHIFFSVLHVLHFFAWLECPTSFVPQTPCHYQMVGSTRSRETQGSCQVNKWEVIRGAWETLQMSASHT